MPDNSRLKAPPKAPLSAMVIHPVIKQPHSLNGHDPLQASSACLLQEAVSLAQAFDCHISHKALVPIRNVRPSTFFTSGWCRTLGSLVRAKHIDIVCVNESLSPIQHRNLERLWHCKVLERTALILHIFADHARSFEGRLQVRMAELTYQKSRLVRTWTHLERQRGGTGGTRALAGPGEHQRESDKRQIQQELTRVKTRLKAIQRTRRVQRKGRANLPHVVLVGYTNAGKSTLFRALTKAHVLVKDQMFATLDPTMRAIHDSHPTQKIILTDTVGFISHLPTHLIAAFEATLEDVKRADIIVHVRDCTAGAHQRIAVEQVLTSMGLEETMSNPLRYIEVLNKIDLVPASLARTIEQECNGYAHRRPVLSLSALDPDACQKLYRHLSAMLATRHRRYRVTMKSYHAPAASWLYKHAHHVTHQQEGEGASFTLHLSPADKQRFCKLFPDLRMSRDVAT
ncbi:MAG: GTPase HflX [Alphaproteobacteria bacterium GM202ARS2]|nr:GTPase HflX [Alphaproteobacteria bacterium GM202ARS2]